MSDGTKESSQGHCSDKRGVECRSQLGIRDGSAPCTQHDEPVGTKESVDGEMLEPSKAM